MNQQSSAILAVDNLTTHFRTERGEVTAVDGVSFSVKPGEILGLVGESGCGKSATAQSLMRLHDEKLLVRYEGNIRIGSTDILQLRAQEMSQLRGNDVSMIFQDPMSSLNPVMSVGDQIIETIRFHKEVSKKDAWQLSVDMLDATGIPDPVGCMKRYPHELSGGMRQRVMISIALVCEPKILIADEPTTALDVTTQAQILEIIRNMAKELDMAVVFITHDLGVVAELCDRVAVMYLGQIIEEASVFDLFTNPLHPYTQGLLASIPSVDSDSDGELLSITGSVPSLFNLPVGCRFASRCKWVTESCEQAVPNLRSINDMNVRCIRAEEIQESVLHEE